MSNTNQDYVLRAQLITQIMVADVKSGRAWA